MLLKRSSFLLLGLALFSGCQYHFAPHPTYFGESFYIDHISNKSAYPQLGPALQAALTKELLRDRALEPVEREHADIIISGVITKVDKNLREQDELSQATESQLVIHFDMKVKTPQETYTAEVSNLSYRPSSSTYRPETNSISRNVPQALIDEKSASDQALKDLARAILIKYSQRSPARFNPQFIKDLNKSK